MQNIIAVCVARLTQSWHRATFLATSKENYSTLRTTNLTRKLGFSRARPILLIFFCTTGRSQRQLARMPRVCLHLSACLRLIHKEDSRQWAHAYSKF